MIQVPGAVISTITKPMRNGFVHFQSHSQYLVLMVHPDYKHETYFCSCILIKRSKFRKTQQAGSNCSYLMYTYEYIRLCPYV